MRPILALNCLLQIAQERSEEESSVGDALALAFAAHVSARLRCFFFFFFFLFVCFLTSYSPALLLMRPHHFVRSCAICSHDSFGMLKSLKQVLGLSLYRFFWERFPICRSP